MNALDIILKKIRHHEAMEPHTQNFNEKYHLQDEQKYFEKINIDDIIEKFESQVDQIPVILDDAQLAAYLDMPLKALHYTYVTPKKFLYKVFKIKKRSGKYRTIHAPRPSVAAVQRAILEKILLKLEPHENCLSFRKGVSIRDAAERVVGAKVVVEFDIENYFDSISKQLVIDCLQKRLPWPHRVIEMVAHIIAPGYVVQGAPTSPAIANLVLYDFDNELTKRMATVGFEYLRYADDIVLYTKKDSFIPVAKHLTEEMENAIDELLKPYGLKLNREKTHYQISVPTKNGRTPIYVLGLKVVEKVNLHPRMFDKISRLIEEFDGTTKKFKIIQGYLAYVKAAAPQKLPIFERRLTAKLLALQAKGYINPNIAHTALYRRLVEGVEVEEDTTQGGVGLPL